IEKEFSNHMITTVTTTTITSLVATASLAAIIVVSLLAILISKEIIGGKGDKAARLGTAVNVAIVPLLLVFVVTTFMRVVEALG
ncbi:MAG: hypothetical protein ABJA50_14105, partial [Chloroflexota bacterium]